MSLEKHKKIKRRLFIASGIILGFLLYGFSWVIAYKMGVSTYTPYPPLDWNNPEGKYIIQKENNNYMIKYILDDYDTTFYVGTSQQDLEPFVNKEVSIKGNFPGWRWTSQQYSDKQCVAGKCHALVTSMFWGNSNKVVPVVDIEAISFVEKL